MDDLKAQARERVVELIDRLRASGNPDAVRPLVELSEQLRTALDAFHMEGVRFRAFALNRLVNQPGAPVGEDERRLVAEIKAALEAAGLPLKH